MNNQFKLNLKDLAKGLVVAVLSSLLAGLYEALQAGGMPSSSQWQTILLAGLGAGVAYLLKNFFTDSVKESAAEIKEVADKQGELVQNVVYSKIEESKKQ